MLWWWLPRLAGAFRGHLNWHQSLRFGLGGKNKARIDIDFDRIVGLDNIVSRRPVL
jgi:hypothetical protein